MTNADQAWSNDAPLDGPPAGLSVGVPDAVPTRPAPTIRRERADTIDAAQLAEPVRIQVRDVAVDPQRDTDAVRRIAESGGINWANFLRGY